MDVTSRKRELLSAYITTLLHIYTLYTVRQSTRRERGWSSCSVEMKSDMRLARLCRPCRLDTAAPGKQASRCLTLHFFLPCTCVS